MMTLIVASCTFLLELHVHIVTLTRSPSLFLGHQMKQLLPRASRCCCCRCCGTGVTEATVPSPRRRSMLPVPLSLAVVVSLA